MSTFDFDAITSHIWGGKALFVCETQDDLMRLTDMGCVGILANGSYPDIFHGRRLIVVGAENFAESQAGTLESMGADTIRMTGSDVADAGDKAKLSERVLADFAERDRIRAETLAAFNAAKQDAPERDTAHDIPPDHAEVPPLDAYAQEAQPRKPARDSWPPSLDLEVLAEQEPQPPRSIMEGIPCGYATLVAGHGGAGKSQIELMRAVCIAAGKEFFGIPTERRRVMYLSCEDRADVLHWRLTRICAYLGVNLASLRGWLEVIDLVGCETLLFDLDPHKRNSVTPAIDILADRIRFHQTEALFVDGISDTYGGGENDRGQVKRFVNSLLARMPTDGAVVLIGHVNKQTADGGHTTSEGYSGSTAWHNSCRARWYLRPELTRGLDDETAQKTGRLILELQKSNHSETGTQIEFKWDEGAHLFVGRKADGGMIIDAKLREKEEQQGIMAALRGCAGHYNVPAATTGQRTAYHVLSVRPEFPESLCSGAKGRKRFWREIEKLRAMGYVKDETYLDNTRHKKTEIVLTSEGMRACGQC